MKKVLILIIKFYKFLISPILGNRCRFLPTCSEYFIEALEKHGFIKGFILGSKRILSCIKGAVFLKALRRMNTYTDGG